MKTTTPEGERIRRAISEREFPTSPLSAALRAEAASYARRRVAEGAARATIAAELGMSAMTVGRWVREVECSALVPVRVVAEHAPARSSFEVVTPRGLRVVGLDIEALYTLIERHG